MLNTESLKEIIELIRKLQPEASEEQLEKTAQNLYEIGLFLVRLKIKEHSKTIEEADKLEPLETGSSP